MKITWIVLDDITAGLKNVSTFNRARLVTPYMPDTTICSTLEFVRGCDVIIYQDRFQQHDVYLAEELVKAGKIVLIDISFPVWNPGFPVYNNDKAGYFKRLANLSSCIIVPVDSYKIDLEHYVKDKAIKVIPNRLNLGLSEAEFTKQIGLQKLDIRHSAEEYMTLIYKVTGSEILESKMLKPEPKKPEIVQSKDIKLKVVQPEEPVSIIIPVWNCLKYLKKCVKSVIKYTDNYELIIIDNGSNKQTKSYIKSLKNVRVVTNSENKGFAYACDQGIKVAKYNYFCLLNSDTIVTPAWLTKLITGLNQSNAGIVGPATTYCQATQRLFDKPNDDISMDEILAINSELQEEYKEIDDLQGFCFLIRKEVVDKIGVFDWSRFYIGGSEEVDFRRRALKAGFKSYWVKHSYVHHCRFKTFIANKLNKHAVTKQNVELLRNRTYTNTNLFIENNVEILETKIDVIMLTLNRQEETIKTLESLFLYNKYLNVIIVDNGSDNLNYLDKFDVKIIKNNKNEGVSKAFNQGLELAKSKYMVLMHNDIVIDTDNWIEKAILFMENNEKVGMVGIAGFKRLTRDVKTTNIITGIDKFSEFDFKRPRGEFEKVIVLDGCCTIVRNIGIKLDENLDYYLYDWNLSMEYRKAEYDLYVMDSKATHFADDRTKATINNIKHKDQDTIREQSKKYFIKKWDKYIPEEVIVTANIAGVDIPMENHFDNTGFRYVMFTDDKSIKSSFWDMRYIEPSFKDPRREARMYKWLIHKFFPDVQYSIWIDSNTVIMSDINAHIRMYLTDADIALVKHWRNCIYEEGKACAGALLDNVKVINTQMERFKQEDYPTNNGLHQTRVIIRRHTKEINALSEAVWEEIQKGSLRDQLSFNYVAWKMGIKIKDIPGKYIMYPSIDKININDSGHFGLVWHDKHNRIYKEQNK